jgi:hypothetical protein
MRTSHSDWPEQWRSTIDLTSAEHPMNRGLSIIAANPGSSSRHLPNFIRPYRAVSITMTSFLPPAHRGRNVSPVQNSSTIGLSASNGVRYNVCGRPLECTSFAVETFHRCRIPRSATLLLRFKRIKREKSFCSTRCDANDFART